MPFVTLYTEVKIKVKPAGFTHWKYFNEGEGAEVKPMLEYMVLADPRGFVRFRMHEFIKIFGPSIVNGKSDLFHYEFIVMTEPEKRVDTISVSL